MKRTNTVVIGGGQAGLAMSRCLTERGIDHVVVERGRIAERWRSERWDSLRLLTPNWLSRLPGFRYDGPDPDGFMTMPEVTAYLERYACSFPAPVETNTAVRAVERSGSGFEVATTRGSWHARNVVVATGYSDLPLVPPIAARLAPDIVQIVPSAYRRPAQLPDGGVLVVGASATGIQLADEIHASGRDVTIAVGRHTRLPRRYRGRDILWWLDAMGLLDASTDAVYDLDISRDQPSLQLVGRPDHASLDLGRLAARGVRLAGRALGADGHTVWFDDDLVATTAASDAKLAMLLGRIDAYVERSGLAGAVEDPEPFEPLCTAIGRAPDALDLGAAGIRTVVWATGFRRHYPWLRVPVLDGRGDIRHRGGVTDEKGLFVLGMHFQRRRKSAFIDGVGDDARDLAARIARRNERLARDIVRVPGLQPRPDSADGNGQVGIPAARGACREWRSGSPAARRVRGVVEAWRREEFRS
jgi:putative flavoprotein involved in K+ transport